MNAGRASKVVGDAAAPAAHGDCGHGLPHGERGFAGGAGAVGAPEHQDALVLANIEARLTQEVLGLMGAVREFAGRTQAIREEIPNGADLCQFVAFFLACSSLNLANGVGLSLVKGIFRNGGREYLDELGLQVNELFREVDLDGQRFLAVALTNEGRSDVLKYVKAGHGH